MHLPVLWEVLSQPLRVLLNWPYARHRSQSEFAMISRQPDAAEAMHQKLVIGRRYLTLHERLMAERKATGENVFTDNAADYSAHSAEWLSREARSTL